MVLPYRLRDGQPEVLTPTSPLQVFGVSMAVQGDAPLTVEAAESHVLASLPDAEQASGFTAGRSGDGQKLIVVATDAGGPAAQRVHQAGTVLAYYQSLLIRAISWTSNLRRARGRVSCHHTSIMAHSSISSCLVNLPLMAQGLCTPAYSPVGRGFNHSLGFLEVSR